ncbi:hypothetical protein [Nonomuraea guangzhouensis]|uniref:Uncharacterized protein n=1 Tax=Nonomuraea guangzhouensis TaxID=1291555 RepID=A0ABW4GWV6_9ACTN|nr:hypothetical protein [Nonomuraea guangzhouensis]
MDALDRLDQADDQWTAAEETAAKLKAELFEAFAAAVRDGNTPDDLAARLKSRKTPEQVEAGLTFSGAYIRRKVREIGIPALPTGPKPRKQPVSE